MSQPLEKAVKKAIANYIENLDGEKPVGVHKMVVGQVEAALLEAIMHYADNNQSHAAEYLGLNRGTLRKKLKEHELI